MTHQQKTINGMVKEKLFEDSHIDIFGDLTKSIEEYIFLTIRDNLFLNMLYLIFLPSYVLFLV